MAMVRGSRVDGAKSRAQILSGPPGPLSQQSNPRSFSSSSNPDRF